jgi:ribosomal protein S18 acetylase RimI-like enzyme
MTKTTTKKKDDDRPKPQLLRAKGSIHRDDGGPPLRNTGDRWETDLGFDELRRAIGASFAGIEGKADGEPLCLWMLAPCDRNVAVRDEAMTFMLSFPLYDGMARRNRMDLSIRTADGALASTAFLFEYGPKKATLRRWWDRVVSKWRENSLVFKLMRQGQLPELVVSKEWKKESATMFRRGLTVVAAMTPAHDQFGPRHLHWYVNFVASNPDLQGQGYGSQLMATICHLADGEGADCYLECSGEKNRKFYEKFGFVEVAALTFEDKHDYAGGNKQIGYAMIRKTQS